jgi:hypothetical protein
MLQILLHPCDIYSISKKMRTLEPIWWDFTDYGLKGTVSLTRLECELLLQGCERMLKTYDLEATELMIIEMGQRLRHDAELGKFTPTWLANAAMLVCLRGLLGEDISRFQGYPV